MQSQDDAQPGCGESVIRFNINEYVRVKFTPASLSLWRKRAEKLRAAYPAMALQFPLEPPTDTGGFYRGQFWHVMHLVAPQLMAGGSAFEDCMIELLVPQPRPVNPSESPNTDPSPE